MTFIKSIVNNIKHTLCILMAMLPFMMWRIRLEEELLIRDPEYREYEVRVPFRLVPGLY